MSNTSKLLLQEFAEFDYKKPIDAEGKPRLSKWGNLLVRGIIQRANALNQNGRVYPKAILEREVKNYLQIVKERRATGELDHCLLGTTEILTKDGWVQLAAISDNAVVATLNMQTNAIEYQQINKKVEVDYAGDLYKITNGKQCAITSTNKHNHILWDRDGKVYKVTSEELLNLHQAKNSKLSHSRLGCSGDWNISSKEEMAIVPGTDYEMTRSVWASFLGLWLSEGFVTGSKGGSIRHKRIGITQKKDCNLEKIKELLAQTGLNWKLRIRKDGTHDWSLNSVKIWNYFAQFGSSSEKFIPRDVLDYSTKDLNNLLDWLLVGDGRNRHDKVSGRLIKEYSSVSKQLVDDVGEVMWKLGMRPFVKTIIPQKDFVIQNRVIPATNCRPLHTVSGNISNTWLDNRFVKVETIPYQGKVFCVNVPNHTFLAREEGYVFWTGNCDSPTVNLQNVSHVITEIWWENDDLWGEIEVLEDLDQGKNLKGLFKNDIKVGISSRALGSVQKLGESNVVQDDLYLVCWDIVSEPSTHGAFMMQEAKSYSEAELRTLFKKSDRLDRAANEVLALRKNK